MSGIWEYIDVFSFLSPKKREYSDDNFFLEMLKSKYSDIWLEITSNPATVVCCPPSSSVQMSELNRDRLLLHVFFPEKREGLYANVFKHYLEIVGEYLVITVGNQEKRVKVISFDSYLDEDKSINVFRIPRPIVGGLPVSMENMDEVTLPIMHKYLAIFRSFPEAERIFIELDDFTSEVNFVARQSLRGLSQIKPSLSSVFNFRWSRSSDILNKVLSSSVDTSQEIIGQVVESYILHACSKSIQRWLASELDVDQKKFLGTTRVLSLYSQSDFGIRPEFQCSQYEAINCLLSIQNATTPIDQLIVFERCVAHLRDAIDRNIELRFPDACDSIELTTDDIIIILVWIICQVSLQYEFLFINLQFINKFHFVSFTKSRLGFNLCHFQVAMYWILEQELDVDEFTGMAELRSRLPKTAKISQTSSFCDYSPQKAASNATNLTPSKLDDIVVNLSTLMKEDKIDAIPNSQLPHDVVSSNSPVMKVLRDLPMVTKAVVFNRQFDAKAGEGPSESKLSLERDSYYCSGIGSLELENDHHQKNDNNRSINNNNNSSSSNNNKIDRVRDVVKMYHCKDGNVHTWKFPSALSLSMSGKTLETNQIRSIVSQDDYWMGIDTVGNVFTWGEGKKGRLGVHIDFEIDSFFGIEQPRLLHQLSSPALAIQQICCGYGHCLALSTIGDVFAWGSNQYGQLGCSTKLIPNSPSIGYICSGEVTNPIVIQALSAVSVRSIACGAYHSLALTKEGEIYSWGRNTQGRLGQLSEKDNREECKWNKSGQYIGAVGLVQGPWRMVTSVHEASKCIKIEQISCGFSHNLAVSLNGEVYSWGCGTYGRLGHGSHCDLWIPAQIEALTKIEITKVATGFGHSVFLSKNNKIYHCGLSRSSYDSKQKDQFELVPIPLKNRLQDDSTETIVDIRSGNEIIMALNSANSSYLWGPSTKIQHIQARSEELGIVCKSHGEEAMIFTKFSDAKLMISGDSIGLMT